MELTRRTALLNLLFGAGAVGLRALATGVPASLLLRPLSARAEEPSGVCPPAGKAQYLVFCTSDSGDPLNANVPGTYAFADIAHPPDPGMAKTSLTLAGKATEAAAPWAGLPQGLLDRTCFFHHATLANNHPQQPKVMRLMGSTRRSEMFVSVYARELSACLQTVQREPVAVGASGVGELLSYEGRTLPKLSPSGLRDALLSPAGPLTNLQKLRDQDLDRLNALFKQEGTSAQRAMLDRMAQSQREARNISQALLDNLSSITGDDTNNQMLAAAALIKMNVSPVVSVHISFGGDNHTDANLQGEATRTISGVASIASLYARLTELGLQDQVTFAAMNVFGRTLKKKGTAGRDHWSNHHCTVMIGKGLKGSVVGGLKPMSGDYGAMAIDSRTGAGQDGADIAFGDTLGAVGKTLGTALGVSAAAVDENISTGKVVGAALA
ncbi:DUF1501 domain-containing protein [Aggregicoccus sp. 17bor-14]|uniref:DUF1501 domain-containing protein n=1 Tax=Myxococcaceae TaxID=31 RepID=UPI00129D120A|nr:MULTISPECIES: DUF1501 domain-containing protein [Myxococcaceae]MBF5043535.1 DUF1501 domain-containing protein [Simulacricoccus sp. 17bor-14]MRI89292.1 DUF1501 domain-containing protein [Aggregicoccus sp. 17bor-14]